MRRPTYILGLSAYYHDSAAALLQDGEIVAAAQEERFTRKRFDSSFPAKSIRFCLEKAKIQIEDVSFVIFYEKPFDKMERLLHTYLAYAPKGFRSFEKAMPLWLKEKLFLKTILKRELARVHGRKAKAIPPLLFSEHHEAHAASAFFPSPYEKAAVLCLDGVGEWPTTSGWLGTENKLEPLWEINFPHSLGLLYSAFTYYTGFKVNSAEYKVMGLAPYGQPKYVDLIRSHLVDIKNDGSFRLNMDYFDYPAGLKMTNDKFNRLFDGPPRKPESAVGQKEKDLAASIQAVTEEIMLKLACSLYGETGAENLCLAGGVALNCVANGRLLREGPFKNIWVQPASGDTGGALGAAYCGWFHHLKQPRKAEPFDSMKGALLGNEQSDDEIRRFLDMQGAKYFRANSYPELESEAAKLLENKNVIGWFQGQMEFGPRSLGARSILADPRDPTMQSIVNLKIKKRESFRPFAPAILEDDASDYFELDVPSPYMLFVAKVRESKRNLPAVTHVDYSARVQTVNEKINPLFYGLLREFKKRTGCPVLLNTSFNVRGEPIVCTVEHAYNCFMTTDLDALVVGHYVLKKEDQPPLTAPLDREFELD
jgi:carbamoyltransferase